MSRFILVILALVALLAGCSAHVQVEPAPGRPGDNCEAFAICREQAGAIFTCIDGDCACAGPTHPGENTPVSCFTGEPDVFCDPWHPCPASEKAQ